LRKNRRSGKKQSLFHFTENFGDVLAREAGEDRDAANRIGERFHATLADDFVCLFQHCLGEMKANEVSRSIIEREIELRRSLDGKDAGFSPLMILSTSRAS